MLKKIVVMSGIIGLSLTSTASAQHNFPTMHAMGRYFGIGWSHGYHSGQQDGRFQSIKDQHPASMYASNSLLYPFHPSYSAQTLSQSAYGAVDQHGMHMSPGHSMNHSMAIGAQGAVLSNQAIGANGLPAPTVAPPVPAEPAPTWLRPFLKDEKPAAEEAPVELVPAKPAEDEELLPAEDSPSDRAKAKAEDDDDLLLPSAQLTPMQRYYEARQRSGSKR